MEFFFTEWLIGKDQCCFATEGDDSLINMLCPKSKSKDLFALLSTN